MADEALFLDVSVTVLPEETQRRLRGVSGRVLPEELMVWERKAHPQCGWVPSNGLPARPEQSRWKKGDKLVC